MKKLVPSGAEGSTGKLYWYPSTALRAGSLGLDVLLETDAAGNTPDEYIFFAASAWRGGSRPAR